MEASPQKKRRASAVDAGSLPDEDARSPNPDEEDEDEDAEGEDAEVEAEAEAEAEDKPAKGKRKRGGAAVLSAPVGTSGTTGAGAAVNPAQAAQGMTPYTEYRYASEIAQMLYVFGEVVDPLPETCHMVEDVVRGQVIELLIRSRSLALLHSSRFLGTDDILFLIRHNRSQIARLRHYLAWKDVRRKAKQESESKGEEAAEVEDMAKGAEAEAAEKKVVTQVVKLPWELLTPFTEFLRNLPTHGRSGAADDEDEDEHELEAYEESIQRLRESDALTRKMSRETYMHFSDCRQASFTLRKAKKFREFTNTAAYLDTKPNDDVTDILGFLSFELVRTLCIKALEIQRGLKEGTPGGLVGNAAKIAALEKAERERGGPRGNGDAGSPMQVDGVRSEGEAGTVPPTPTAASVIASMTLEPLQPRHILAAYQKMQRDDAARRTGGAGMRNFRGGVVRRRAAIL